MEPNPWPFRLPQAVESLAAGHWAGPKQWSICSGTEPLNFSDKAIHPWPTHLGVVPDRMQPAADRSHLSPDLLGVVRFGVQFCAGPNKVLQTHLGVVAGRVQGCDGWFHMCGAWTKVSADHLGVVRTVIHIRSAPIPFAQALLGVVPIRVAFRGIRAQGRGVSSALAACVEQEAPQVQPVP